MFLGTSYLLLLTYSKNPQGMSCLDKLCPRSEMCLEVELGRRWRSWGAAVSQGPCSECNHHLRQHRWSTHQQRSVWRLFCQRLACCSSWKQCKEKVGRFFLKNKFILFIYLFLAALGLRCCAWAFSSCGERGLLFVVVRGLLIAVASLVAEHGL